MQNPTNGDGETILVVDDAEAIRKMVCAMLSQHGFRCLEASDGAEALRVLQNTHHVKLVLTDIVMPNMNGADLARHLSRTRPDMRIMFMSGYAGNGYVSTGEVGPAVFLAKPFTATLLMEKIRQALELPGPDSPAGRNRFGPQ